MKLALAFILGVVIAAGVAVVVVKRNMGVPAAPAPTGGDGSREDGDGTGDSGTRDSRASRSSACHSDHNCSRAHAFEAAHIETARRRGIETCRAVAAPVTARSAERPQWKRWLPNQRNKCLNQ